LFVRSTVSNQGFQSLVFDFKAIQSPGFSELEAAVFGLSAVVGILCNAEPADDILNLLPRRGFLQNRNDLLGGVLALAHLSSISSEGLTFQTVQFSGSRSKSTDENGQKKTGETNV
jgi:hypothetical protein